MTNEIVAVPTITPMSLIERAMAANASIEQMTQLFELQLRYEGNEAKKAYNMAMSNFRSECPEIDKTRKGHNGKYAGLAETIQVINPVLAKNGLSHQWRTEQLDGGVKVTCIVTHVLGHFEQTCLSAAGDKSGGKTDIHALASTISYLERYTLFAMLGLASMEMDDDGNGGGKKDVAIIDEHQTAVLETLLEEVKGVLTTEKNVSAFCAAFKIRNISELPVSEYSKAIKSIEAKKAKL